MGIICNVGELEKAVGSRMLPVMMKSIDRLDEHCEHLLSLSPAMVLGYLDGDGRPRAEVLGGAVGFAVPESPTSLPLPLPADAAPGTGAALLVLIPGWRETLRINGTVRAGGLTVTEAFLHCGKAVLRSNLWSPATPSAADTAEEGLGAAATAFLAAAPFTVITSRDGADNADASPKGDPPGVIRPIGPTTVAIAERPGNRRTDTFHNVLEHPEVAVVALCPGDDRTLELSGTASLSTDPELLESMAERGKAPKAVLLLEVVHSRLAVSAAIRDSRLWDTDRHADPAQLPRASKVWADHMKLNETTGFAAKLIRGMSNERLLRAGVEMDYKQNLY
ncbi:hypothetical protein D5S17_08170 [Pseudonocardiaceae bacterium YIM PH 21723]|nr:hypothetical protein D5S17_08170 [Pseudonocardiaceae bacterium YIM PH 21723]